MAGHFFTEDFVLYNTNKMMKPTIETYAELTQAYDFFNQKLFNGALPGCLITLQREKHTVGYFSAGRFANTDGQLTDEIAINPSYFAVAPIVEVLQTLAHEQTHQWQARFGTPGRGRYHNKEWADKMESIGLMPSSTGRPGGAKTGDSIADYAIEGGLFLQACKELLTESFKLSWYDRFPDERAVINGQNSMATRLENMPDSATRILARDESSQVVVQVRAPAGPDVELKKPTRVKYTCDCETNIWAKPGIEVRCCACDSLFQAE